MKRKDFGTTGFESKVMGLEDNGIGG